jgi:hypothetical protein
MTKTIRPVAIFLFAVALYFGLAFPQASAQNAAGRILGNVTDPSGAAVADASVTATNVATQVAQQTTTDKDGFYQILALPIGNYRVVISKDGFQQQAFENQVLQINQSLRVDAKLALGQQNEIVEVRDQVETVETVNPTVGATVTGRAISDSPLNGRNVLDLAKLQPGVTEANPDDTSGGGNGNNANRYNIAGGRADSVTFLLDGGINNEILGNNVVFNPNPDTIEEFKILENNYTAEYGRNGGGVITEVVKSGTNQWHGSAFDFIRNDAFNANTFFNNKAGVPREILKRHQFGGTFGGPVTIPHLVHGKDRFFFFVGYQRQKQTQVQSVNGIVTFTPDQLKGDFSGRGTPTGPCPNADANVAAFLQAHPFFQSIPAQQACAVIDPAKINGVAKNYIAAGLIATDPTGIVNNRAVNTLDNHELTMKFDLNVTQNDRLAVTLGGIRQPQTRGTGSTGVAGQLAAPGYPLTASDKNYFSNFAYTRTFSPNVLNEFRVTVQRTNALRSKPARTIPTHQAIGEVGITPDLELGAAVLQFADQGTNFGFNIGGPSTLINNTFAYSDTVSWNRGHHSWKFGGSFSAYQFNTAFDFIGNGVFQFVGNGGLYSKNGLADFLFGLPSPLGATPAYQQSPNAPTNARTKFTSGFAQDEWRVNKRLVLTMGVRYEYSTPKTDTHNILFSVIPGLHSTVFPNAPSGLVFPGDKGAPKGVNFPDKNNWAPRFGFAFDPTGNSKTSIRGGFGIFYDILKAEDNFQDNGQPPFFAGAALNFPALTGNPTQDLPFLAQPFGNDTNNTPNPFPSKPVNHNIDFGAAGFLPWGATSIFLDDPHLKTPYTYQYNLSIQREVLRNTTLEASYIGSSSHGLTALIDINPFKLGTTDRVLNLLPGNTTCDGFAGTGRCSFTSLPTFKNVGKASYNGLTASLTRRFSDTRYIGSTYFTFGYTWGHSIDTTSGFRERNSQVPTFQPNLFRGPSDFDIRNRITFSGGWDLPFDRAWSGGPKRLTQGWTLYPIVSWRTGFPLDVLGQPSITGFFDPGVSGVGDNIPFANLTGQPIGQFDPHKVQTLNGNTGNFYFNPNAFTTAQVGPGSCSTPSPTCFPTSQQVIANPSLATYGTVRRGLFRGPGRTNVDLTGAKTTALTERLKLEIRADVFNLFNHAEFGNPITNIGSPKFGQIVTTGDQVGNPIEHHERIIQVAARFSF